MNAITGIRPEKNISLPLVSFIFFSLQFETCCYSCESGNTTTKLMYSYSRNLLAVFYISFPKVKIDNFFLAALGLLKFRFLPSFAGKSLNILPLTFIS